MDMHIVELELATHALADQIAFYTRLLGVLPPNAAADHVRLQIGASQLIFRQADSPLPASYHFAFNIPNNQFDEATRWIQQHVSLIPDASGADTFYSENWDAHNLYFYDPAGNIVELIARHTLPSASDAPFGGHSLLNISEIGVAADDVAAQVDHIRSLTGATPYGSFSSTFAPVGDEHGLLIVVQRRRIWFPDTGKPAEHLPIAATIATDSGTHALRFG
jgi:catechol 2,3-dioxygenase-like lactoylglutathione lyase family enzyme